MPSFCQMKLIRLVLYNCKMKKRDRIEALSLTDGESFTLDSDSVRAYVKDNNWHMIIKLYYGCQSCMTNSRTLSFDVIIPKRIYYNSDSWYQTLKKTFKRLHANAGPER